MTAQIKVKVQRRPRIRLKVLPHFPSSVTGDNGILVNKNGGHYRISIDGTALPNFSGAMPFQVGDLLYASDASTLAALPAGTLGYHLGSNGPDTPPSYQGFLQSGTGAATRTWQNKLRDALDVRDFGAACNGVTLDDDAVAAAAAEAVAQGKALRFSGGYCLVSGTVTPPAGSHWIADKYQAPSGIRSTSATANIIDCSAGFITLENLSITTPTTRTAGAHVYLNDTSNVTLRNLFIAGAFRGVQIKGSTNVTQIYDTTISGTIAATGVGLDIDTDQYVYARNLFIGGSAPFANILVSSGLLDLDYAQLLGGTHGIFVSPNPGVSETVAASINISRVYADQQTASGITLSAINGAAVQRVTIHQCWMSQVSSKVSGTNGVSISSTGTGTVNGVDISTCQLYGNDSGVVISGAGCSNIKIVNNEIGGSNNAIYLDAATRVIIANNKIGAVAGFTSNVNGINLIAGASDYLTILGNELNAVDNTTPFTNGSTGTHNIIDIANTDGHVYRRSGLAVGFGSLDISQAATVGTSRLAFANLTQGSARSVLGVTGNATANFASIQGSAGQILAVPNAGTSLAFTSTPQLGVSGTLGSLTFGNATSGLLTIQPIAGALGTTTTLIPVNETLVGKATTDELTNKTLTSSVAKGTWTASGTWTIPAVTLGGTVSGGGNQLNNIIIGTSTPLAGSFTTVAASTSVTVTSTSASTLTAGRQGATNPALQVDASTASSATGLKIKAAAAAGGLALSVITSGTNENLTIDAAGSGTITLGGTSTGAIIHTRATTLSAALTYGGVTLSNAVTGTGNMVLATSPTLSTSLLMDSGFVQNWNAGNITLTHSAGKLAYSAGAQIGIGVTPSCPLDVKSGVALAARFTGTGGNNTQIRLAGATDGDLWIFGTDVSTGGGTKDFEIFDLGASASALKIVQSTNLATFRGAFSTTDTTASTSSTTGAIKSAGGLAAAGAIWAGTYAATTPTTVGALPAAAAGLKGARMFVTDANAATFGTTAAGGGANNVPVWCDGTVWKIG